jgi:hypothetical protein
MTQDSKMAMKIKMAQSQRMFMNKKAKARCIGPQPDIADPWG